MEEIYDMEATYLYMDGYQYRIGKIDKVNDKSIRMDFGVKILKENFNKLYKLTDKEVERFRGDIIKKLSTTCIQMGNLTKSINGITCALSNSPFVNVDSEKLKAQLDILSTHLLKEVPQVFVLDDKELVFYSDYSERIVEVKKDGEV